MKNCGCNSHPTVSWYDLQDQAPTNPFDLIAYADLDSQIGVFEYSQDFLNSGGTWVATPITVQNGGLCDAWRIDDEQKVGDVLMWSQQHQVTNAATDLAIPLRKMMFLRGGTEWKMQIPLDFGVALDTVQLSLLDNAGTRGDAQGTIPVLRFNPAGANFPSGNHVLTITLKGFGSMSLGLKSDATGSGDQGMMEMDWIIVP